jgi:hypothetical protein
MHPYSDLVQRCAALTQRVVADARGEVLAELEISGATILVKALQAVELHQTVVSVGLFAMFEAALQDALGCEYGLQEAVKVVEHAGEKDLAMRFRDLHLAINVLKHGKGRSHKELLSRRNELPFRVREEDESFDEGDVAELATLVKTDEEFLRYCASTIDEVSAVIKRQNPQAFV